MSRGPHAKRTLADAIPIAEMRGTIHLVRRSRGSLYDFVISSAIPVAFVRVKRAYWILLTIPDVEVIYREVINGLRAIVSTENISRELWLRSRHGTWQFFRVTENSLIELSRDGKPLSTPDKDKVKSLQ